MTWSKDTVYVPDSRYPEKFTISSAAELSISTTDITMENTYTFEIQVSHKPVALTTPPTPVAPFNFTVIVRDNPCEGGVITLPY